LAVLSSQFAELRTQNSRKGVGPQGPAPFCVREPVEWLFDHVIVVDGPVVIRTSAGLGPLVTCENRVRLSGTGVFQFDVAERTGPSGPTDCRVVVHEGAAAAELATITTVLTRGQGMFLDTRAGDMLPTLAFPVVEMPSVMSPDF